MYTVSAVLGISRTFPYIKCICCADWKNAEGRAAGTPPRRLGKNPALSNSSGIHRLSRRPICGFVKQSDDCITVYGSGNEFVQSKRSERGRRSEEHTYCAHQHTLLLWAPTIRGPPTITLSMKQRATPPPAHFLEGPKSQKS